MQESGLSLLSLLFLCQIIIIIGLDEQTIIERVIKGRKGRIHEKGNLRGSR